MFYIATVRLLIEANSESEASDACGEILRDHCQDFAPGSSLVTWAFDHDVEPSTLDRNAYPVGASYDAPVDGAK